MTCDAAARFVDVNVMHRQRTDERTTTVGRAGVPGRSLPRLDTVRGSSGGSALDSGPIGRTVRAPQRTAPADADRVSNSLLRRVVFARHHHDRVGSGSSPIRSMRLLAPETAAHWLATHHHRTTLPGQRAPESCLSSDQPARRILCSRPDRPAEGEGTRLGVAVHDPRPVLRPVGRHTSTPHRFPAVSDRLTLSRVAAGTMVEQRKPPRSRHALIGYGDGRWWGPTRPGDASGGDDRAATRWTSSTRALLGLDRWRPRFALVASDEQNAANPQHRLGPRPRIW